MRSVWMPSPRPRRCWSDLRDAGYRIAPGDDLRAACPGSRSTGRSGTLSPRAGAIAADLQAICRPPGARRDRDPMLTPAGVPLRGHASRQCADRATTRTRRSRRIGAAEYHDLTRVPRHAYVAFYRWLRQQADALVRYQGAHGTLEWLPGKSVAPVAGLLARALVGDLPVIYPFIVNDPGESRTGQAPHRAVTLGHVPPPLRRSARPNG